jgi:hypothetical protein
MNLSKIRDNLYDRCEEIKLEKRVFKKKWFENKKCVLWIETVWI